jgi:hypothetical protein
MFSETLFDMNSWASEKQCFSSFQNFCDFARGNLWLRVSLALSVLGCAKKQNEEAKKHKALCLGYFPVRHKSERMKKQNEEA